MAGQGPALHVGEAEGVIEFVLKRARQLKNREITIPLEDLKPLLFGATEESHYMNRIRWKMRDHFKKAKIDFRCKGDAYDFIINPSVDLNIESEKQKINLEKITPVQTSTKFQEPFIPPTWFNDLMQALMSGVCKPIIKGPHGCGKSRAAEEAFARLGLETLRITLGEIRDPADLIGTKEIVNVDGVPTTKLVGGMITEAMEKGYGVILDEYDICEPGVLAALNKVMEEGIEMTLPGEEGVKKFRPHPNFKTIATANTDGRGDASGLYSGTKTQNESSMDRLYPLIPTDYDIDIEKRVISPYLPPKVVDALYNTDHSPTKRGIVLKIRDAIKDPQNPLDDVLGSRLIYNFARLWNCYGWSKGMYYMIAKMREHNHDAIYKIITDRLGSEFRPSRNDYSKMEPYYIPDMMPKIIEAGFGH